MTEVVKLIKDMYIERLNNKLLIDSWVEDKIVRDVFAKMGADSRVVLMKEVGVFDEGTVRVKTEGCVAYIKKNIVGDIGKKTKEFKLTKGVDLSIKGVGCVDKTLRGILQFILNNDIVFLKLNKANCEVICSLSEGDTVILLEREEFENLRILLDLLSIEYKLEK